MYDINNNENNNQMKSNENAYHPNFENTNATSEWKVYENQPQNQAQHQAYSGTFASSEFDFQPDAKKQKNKKSNKGKVAALILSCMVLSAGCGFGGTLLAQQLNPNSTQKLPVLTQSLVNTSNQDGAASSVAEVAAATAGTVVEITTESVTGNNFMQQYTTTGAGSGVIITADGYIITNHHVIEDARTIKVTLRNGTSYDAKLVGTDEQSDIAVIKIEETGLTPAVLGDSDTLTVGELAVAIGNPLGQLGGTVTDGIISALDREITVQGQTMHLLQTSAAINPGNSGGGLFNSKGELIGIVNAKTLEAGIEGLGFAIPINKAKEIATELIENGYVTGRVQLGVSLIEIQDEQTAMQYQVRDLGVYIAQVNANSDAYYGGLKAGDLIKKLNGKDVASNEDVKSVIDESSVGDVLTFVVSRNGKEQTVEITLTEYNSNANKFVS